VAKLTLSFKDRKLKVFALPTGDCVIGRNPDCTIVIDSLAVAPEHARIRHRDGAYFIEPVGTEFELSVGQQPVKEAQPLSPGDVIRMGKHSLAFSEDNEGVAVTADVIPLPSAGWLQIQNGSHMGRTIRLNKAFTRVGKPNGELAVIARRDDGYYLSALQGNRGPQVNDQAIGDSSHRLHDQDNIAIGELRVQFFADGHSARESELPPTEQRETPQRKFSRIPFEVDVTLHDEQRRWETRLLDISLHGALVTAPATFAATEDKRYRLTVHLEGGPDICMDVEVAHREDDELGLNCKDIDVDSITHLRRLVELNLGDPDLLERELSALG
jgi:pSer/pThr/pTyr-binding forkhead associated (FHA) protein